VPFIAAINGSAVGFGLTMTLPMDVRLCADNAKLGLVFSRRGVVIDAASSWFLPRVVSMSWAAEWAYTGRLFTAGEAMRSGLVRDALPASEVLPAARMMAESIAEANPVSVSLTKALLWRGSSFSTPRDVHRIDTAALAELGHRPDASEGVRAFLEKRPPRFESRVSTDMPAVYPWWDDSDDR
jgi:enoyl-CoA hydratase/carnithine racemase